MIDKADVTWYQFRIPIYDYETTVGDISDFKTIRFMRMFMTGFEDTTFLGLPGWTWYGENGDAMHFHSLRAEKTGPAWSLPKVHLPFLQ